MGSPRDRRWGGPVLFSSGGLGRDWHWLGDGGVGGGGQGVRSMGAFGGDAGEEPVEVGPGVEAAPQAAAEEAVKASTARAGFDVA